MTITGQIYGWGENRQGQACPENTLPVCSIPKMISLPTGETASDISAFGDSTFILTDIGHIYVCGSFQDSNGSRIIHKLELNKLDTNISTDVYVRKIFSSEEHIFGSIMEDSFLPLSNFKALEKLFLNKMKQILKNVIEPLCENSLKEEDKTNTITDCKISLYNTTLNLVAMIGQSVLNSLAVTHFEDCTCLGLIKTPQDFSKVLEDYTKVVCDCLAIECFSIDQDSKMYQSITEILENLCHIHHENGANDALKLLLMEPTNQIEHYLTCLKAMVLAKRNAGADTESGPVCDTVDRVILQLKVINMFTMFY